jgi:DNA mismatch endonuclease, patch repair protein
MADKISIEARSANMSKIRSKNTKPEKYVRSFFHSSGLRFRLDKPKLPGKPDIILRKYMTVVFVDGCFWHRHEGCKYSTSPKTRKKFWENKFKNNIKRDAVINLEYKSLPWRIIRIWQCEINQKYLSNLVLEIKK